MKKLALTCLALGAAAFLLAGCTAPQVPRPQSVADKGGGQFWAAGCQGHAASFDGTSLVRHDYPVDPETRPCGYKDGSVALAWVVVRDGVPYLFTRDGKVMVWQEASWSRLATTPTAGASPEAEIDDVHLLPDGRWMVHLHSRTLLFATHEELLASRFTSEEIPAFATWVGVLDGVVYALGRAGGGAGVRAFRLQGPGQWITWHLPESWARTLLKTPRGEVAAVVEEGLVILERDGQPVEPSRRPFLPAKTLVYRALPSANGRQLLQVFGPRNGLAELTADGPLLWEFSDEAITQVVSTILVADRPHAVLMDGRVVAPLRRTRLNMAEVAGP